jgi:hypothetical protein
MQPYSLVALLAALGGLACGRTVVHPPMIGTAETPATALLDSDEEPPAAVPTQSLDAAPPDAAPSVVDPELLARMTFRGEMPSAIAATDPAARNANASSEHCRKEVQRRGLPVVRVKSAAKGIADSVRLTGPMHDVTIVVPQGKHGLLDCRLALALDDLTAALSELGVKKIVVDNFYRPGAKLPGQKKPSQHAHGLAIDLNTLELRDGRVLSTADWGASIGEIPCGPDAVMAEPTAARVDVRNLMCEVGRRRLFHTVLTPSFNAAHASHFHLDIKRDSTFASVR